MMLTWKCYIVIVLFSAFVFFTDKDRCKGMATERKIHSILFSSLIYLYPDSFSQNTFFFYLRGQIKGILALRLNGYPCIFLCSVKWKAKKDGERRRIPVSGHYWLVPIGYS